jgi:hypothetical protein
MDTHNHYEAAFKSYLQWHGYCFVAVHETDRSQLGDETLKNLDFIVHGEDGTRLLVDIKGRRFPTGSPGRRRRIWECWSTLDDINGLERWRTLFGAGYRGLLVFTYEVLPEIPLFADTEDLWTWQNRRYLLRAVEVEEYRKRMRVRSPKWGTVTLPRAAFRALVRPFRHFTLTAQSMPASCAVV